QNGLRASFKGSRLVEFAETQGLELSEAKKQGLNQVLLIQVPLKQRRRERYFDAEQTGSFAAPSAGAVMRCRQAKRSDVDEAVISHGEVEGPFTEIDGLPIERDERFPIRVTVQLYQATGNGVVDAADIARLADQIEDIYRGARSIGSLVLDGESGHTT